MHGVQLEISCGVQMDYFSVKGAVGDLMGYRGIILV